MPCINVPVTAKGALFSVHVGLDARQVISRRNHGLKIPSPVKGLFLLDTGASTTTIDTMMVQKLDLQAIGTASIHTPSTDGVNHSSREFEVSLWIPGNHEAEGFGIPSITVLEASLSSCGIDGLIGQDLINRCTFVYNGSAKIASLCY